MIKTSTLVVVDLLFYPNTGMDVKVKHVSIASTINIRVALLVVQWNLEAANGTRGKSINLNLSMRRSPVEQLNGPEKVG